MEKNKSLIVIKENIFKRLINKLKSILFRKIEENSYEKVTKEIPNCDTNNVVCNNKQKEEFLKNIKIEDNTGIISLKIKLENGEIKAIDLTEEQIKQLQEIYDKEIVEKQNKIKMLKKIA